MSESHPGLEGRRVLVTGAGGMVGSNLTRALLSAGARVTGVIRPGGERSHLPDIDLVEADLEAPDGIARVVAESSPQVVFSLARSRADSSPNEVARAEAVNAAAVEALLDAAAALSEPPVLVHLGSHLERGGAGGYADSKRRATELCLDAARAGAVPAVVLRPVSLYGPWDRPERLVGAAIRAALAGTELELTAPGVRRDWLYTGDLVDACLRAAGGAVTGEVVDLGTGRSWDNAEVAEMAARAAGAPLRVAAGRVEPRPWDGEPAAVSPEPALRLLGWRPRTSLQQGLALTVEWLRPQVSVVAPVYRCAEALPELAERVSAALAGAGHELILVDDASPDDSGAVADELARSDDRVRAIHLRANGGQHAAVLAGMAAARGERILIMDADLQDPPEAIPGLLERGREGAGAVFAARRGRYEGPGRRLSSRAFKGAMSALLGLPKGSGMFVALDRDAADRVLGLAAQGPPPFVVAMIARSGVEMDSVPVERSVRPRGESSYSPLARAASAARAFRWALPRRGPGGERRRAAHNEGQRRYYSGAKPNMEPRASRYLERHVDELVAFTGVRPGDRVLDVGCGLGRYTLPLARRGLRVEGIDISPELLERLRDTLPDDAGVTLHLADVLDPPQELRGRFDAVLGGFVLHHIHDVPASLRSMAALAKPGGALAFLEPNPFNPLYYAQMAISPTMTWEGDKGMLGMRRRPLLAAMRAAGVHDPGFERFGFFPPFIADRPRAGGMERRIEGLAPLGPVLPFQLVGGRVGGAGPPGYL